MQFNNSLDHIQGVKLWKSSGNKQNRRCSDCFDDLPATFGDISTASLTFRLTLEKHQGLTCPRLQRGARSLEFATHFVSF